MSFSGNSVENKMETRKFISDFWKTSGYIKTSVLGSIGWDVRIVDASQTSGLQVFLYYHDCLTKFSWMASVPAKQFAEFGVAASAFKENEILMVRNSLQYLACEAIQLGPEKIKGSEIEDFLGAVIALYAWTTQTIKLANGLVDGGHFFVLNYRNQKNKDSGLLRPFCRPSAEANSVIEPVSVDLFRHMISSVVEIDKARHPEWFRS